MKGNFKHVRNDLFHFNMFKVLFRINLYFFQLEQIIFKNKSTFSLLLKKGIFSQMTYPPSTPPSSSPLHFPSGSMIFLCLIRKQTKAIIEQNKIKLK